MYNQGGISYNQAPATLDDIKALLNNAITCYYNLINTLESQNIPELQGQVITLLKQGEIKKAEERMNNALLYENHVSGLKTTISFIKNLIGILGSLTENNLERYMTHVASSFYSLNFYYNPSLLRVQSTFESSFKNFSAEAIKQGSYVDSRLISCFSIQKCEESVIKNNIIIIARQSQIRLPDNYEMTALPQTNRNNTASRPSYPVVPTSIPNNTLPPNLNPNTSLNQAAIPEMFTANSSSSKVPNAKFYYPYPDQNLPKGVPVPDIIKKHYHSFVSSSSFCPAIDPPPYPLSLEPFDSDLADSSTKSMNAFSGQPEAPASNSKNGNYLNGLHNVGPLPIVPQPAKNDLPLYTNVQQAQPVIPSPFHQRNTSTNSIGMNNPGYFSAVPTVSHPTPSPRKPINYNKVIVNTANGKQEFNSLPNCSQPINMGNYLPSDNTLNDPSYNLIDQRNVPTAPLQPMPSVMSLSKLPSPDDLLDMDIQCRLYKEEQKKHQN